ncbi:SCO2322 family protein [Ornithinicoccus halotolerans]|uniref:SCO2322 family protein n=1 Tax=Ornithinicoccus halotolerans TaxID=1748220 RepID=UPI0012979082|nr:SCO2322 family protein [Ornithinicoccus halotolerans]
MPLSSATPPAPSRPLRVPLALLTVLLLSLLGGQPAAAQGDQDGGEGGPAPGFRFWGYYQLQDGEWAFATEGAHASTPEDGSVEGWRFAVTAEDDVRFPRATPAFEELCLDQPEAAEGDKRVGVVVDPGRDVDAPEGEQRGEPSGYCAVVPADATGLEVLQAAVGEVRTDADGGMVCGVAGYPESGCGEPVAEVTEEQQQPDEPVELPAVAGGGTQEAEPGATTEAPAGDDAGTPEQTGEAEQSDEGTAWWAWALVVLGALVLLWLVLRARSRSRVTD